MTTILLIRHGQNDWVNKHRLAGWIPGVHLNDTGQQQAVDAAQRLADLPIKAIYSSPVTRCLETAQHLADTLSLPITQLPEVGEVRYGDWEGKKIKKLAKDPRWYIVQHFPSRLQFPEGETLRAVQFRAVEALERLSQAHPDQAVAVFSHADLIKLVLAHYLGTHIDLFQRIAIAPASVSVIQLPARGTVRVLRINDDGPLRLPKPPEKKEKESDKKKKGKKKKKKSNMSKNKKEKK